MNEAPRMVSIREAARLGPLSEYTLRLLEKQKKLLSEKVDINGYYMAEMDRLAKAGRKG